MTEPAEPDEVDEVENASGPPRRSPRSKDVLAALRSELTGFEVQDKDVDLSSGDATLRADWVGTERAGRIVVAAWRADTDDAAIVWAVEAVAFARRLDAQDPASRKGRAVAPMAQKTLAALIVPRGTDRLKAALALLPHESFALFEITPRESGGRARPALVRCDLRGSGGGVAPSAAGVETWPAAARALAESLAARVRRIDPSIESQTLTAGLVWRFAGEECATLSYSAGNLIGAWAAGGNVERIADDAGAEVWLEHVLRAHCLRLRHGPGVARPADLLARGRPLLSAEELAAFRD